MRQAIALLVAAVAAGALPGCLDDGGLPELTAFTATYERMDGSRFTVRFEEPRPLLGADGEVRLAYVSHFEQDGWPGSGSGQALDAALRPMRVERCWVWDEGRHCGHRETDFQNGSVVPDLGIAGPWARPDHVRKHDGLVSVEAGREGLSVYEYDYRPGELWPQAYVRRAADFDFEEVQWRLANVDVGPRIVGKADAWPYAPAVAEGPAPVVFPGADRMFAPFPFTVQAGVDALAADPDAGKALDGGCVSTVFYWAPPFRDGQGSLLPPLQPVEEDRMMFTVHDAGGKPSGWRVTKMRDTFGAESLEVVPAEPGEPTFGEKPFPCSERTGVAVGADQFVDGLPAALKPGDFSQFRAGWWPELDGSGLHLHYETQWRPRDGAHFGSGTIDASTGLWTRFTYLPGEGVDPAEPEQNG